MPAAKSTATKAKKPVKRKPAASSSGAKPSVHQAFMKSELAKLKKQYGYVSGGTKNKVEWSAIFSEASANWSARKK